MDDFLERLFHNLEMIGADLAGLTIDHIAYRAASVEEGDELQARWSAQHLLLKSAQINGREVLVYECHPPLQYGVWEIPGLELMYPKLSKPFGGWDHIEVVLGPYVILSMLYERDCSRDFQIYREMRERVIPMKKMDFIPLVAKSRIRVSLFVFLTRQLYVFTQRIYAILFKWKYKNPHC